MHWLFICSTGLQFLSAVAMIEQHKKEMKEGEVFDVDLVLIRRRRETLRIAEVLEQLQCFREVYILNSESISSLKHLLKNPENMLPRLLKRFSFTQDLARRVQFGSQLSLEFDRYTDFFPKLGYRNTEPAGKFLRCPLAEGIFFLTHTYFYDII